MQKRLSSQKLELDGLENTFDNPLPPILAKIGDIIPGAFYREFREFMRILTNFLRSFEKGLADRGGWREEIFHMPEIQASFLCPFSYAPLGEGDTFLENFLGSFGGFVCRQPLFETSDKFP